MRAVLVALSLLVLPAVVTGAAIQSPIDAGPPSALAGTDGANLTDGPSAAGTDVPLSGVDARASDIAFLTLGESDRARLTSQSVDAAASVSIARDDAAARLESYAVEERLDAGADGDRTLDAALDDVETRIDALLVDERALRSGYANGSIDAAAFVREFARARARTVRLQTRLAILEATAESRDVAVPPRLDRLDRRLLGYDGPVRDRTLASLLGSDERIELYAAASANGTVLATIEDGVYVREAFRADWRVPSDTTFSPEEAIERANELYPVAYELNARAGLGNSFFGRGASTYLFEIELPFGSVRSYLDGTTENVFAEVQRRSIDRFPQPRSVTVRSNGTASVNGTRLVVNRTFAGGPLRIATYDNASGKPLDLTVAVENRRVRTGPDGVAHALASPGRWTTVEAFAPDGNVSTVVRALPITPINGSA